MIRTQRITDGHLNALCELEDRLFDAGSFPLSRRAFSYHIKGKGILLGAFDGEVLAGYILVFLYTKSGRIYSLGVAPEYRRRGIASLLIERAEEIVMGRHKNRLSLEVRADNLVARRLYEALGFLEEKSLPAYYPDGGDGLKMAKPLP